MLSGYQLEIADLYNILIGNVKKLVPNFFEKKSMCFVLKTYINLFKTRIKTKKVNCALEFNRSQWLKPYIEHTKKTRNRKK